LHVNGRHVVPLQNVEKVVQAPGLAEGIVHDHVVADGCHGSDCSVITQACPSQHRVDLGLIEHAGVLGGAHRSEGVDRKEEPGVGQDSL
jgi:hypothetical protein